MAVNSGVIRECEEYQEVRNITQLAHYQNNFFSCASLELITFGVCSHYDGNNNGIELLFFCQEWVVCEQYRNTVLLTSTQATI